MTKKNALIFLGIGLVLLVGLAVAGWFFWPQLNPKMTEQIQSDSETNQTATDESAAVPKGGLSGLLADQSNQSPQAKLVLSDAAYGLSAQSLPSLTVVKSTVPTLYATVFLPTYMTTGKVAVTLVADKSKSKLGPVVAEIKVENNQPFAVVTIQKPARDWPLGPYQMVVNLADGSEITQAFEVP
jgi:hypothetical protein